ncbi:hypothetical protein NM688_g3765 [Phlebia brevispora]|uniref:Uncharacterized protein n=1 Tax=Phlebia brevispora TaxID=194682 RepID=A0ACC1T4L6_9APHY|nr:hypothetical protein NM688_g3765 [Phlebia brevispora]
MDPPRHDSYDFESAWDVIETELPRVQQLILDEPSACAVVGRSIEESQAGEFDSLKLLEIRGCTDLFFSRISRSLRHSELHTLHIFSPLPALSGQEWCTVLENLPFLEDLELRCAFLPCEGSLIPSNDTPPLRLSRLRRLHFMTDQSWPGEPILLERLEVPALARISLFWYSEVIIPRSAAVRVAKALRDVLMTAEKKLSPTHVFVNDIRNLGHCPLSVIEMWDTAAHPQSHYVPCSETSSEHALSLLEKHHEPVFDFTLSSWPYQAHVYDAIGNLLSTSQACSLSAVDFLSIGQCCQCSPTRTAAPAEYQCQMGNTQGCAPYLHGAFAKMTNVRTLLLHDNTPHMPQAAVGLLEARDLSGTSGYLFPRLKHLTLWLDSKGTESKGKEHVASILPVLQSRQHDGHGLDSLHICKTDRWDQGGEIGFSMPDLGFKQIKGAINKASSSLCTTFVVDP